MKEAFASNPSGDNAIVHIRDAPIPTPEEKQVVVRVIAAGLNPKDWKVLKHEPLNSGDDVAGYVHSVGEKVTEFKPGDRVAAFHQMLEPHGGFAEYAVVWASTTFHIPKQTSFEEASTIPLAGLTAAIALYQDLCLPLPWHPAPRQPPFIVYGGSSAVGSFAIKLASLSNIHPLIVVAGKSVSGVEPLLYQTKGDKIIDYKAAGSNDAIVAGLRNALGGEKALFAFDAVSSADSVANIGHVLDPVNGRLAVVLPQKEPDLPVPVEPINTYVGSVHTGKNVFREGEEKVGTLDNREFGVVFCRLFGRGLAEGWFSGHPLKIVEGGLEGLAGALNNLRLGKVGGFKYVVRIADTPGIQE